MAFNYPISLDVTGRRCVVIGGGGMAENKARDLVYAGARVTVISSETTEGLRVLARDEAVELVRREYRQGDLEGVFLAIAADDDRSGNKEIFQEASARNVLLNAVDDVEHCHFAAPSIVRRGDLAFSISTGGKAPALARRLAEGLSRQFGPEWGLLLDVLGEVREETLPRRKVDFATWVRRWQAALDHDLIGMIQRGEVERARETVRQALEDGTSEAAGERPAGQGSVSIVGAGPGDPGLITVRGRQLLDQADVVVHDRLVNPDMFAGKHAISVGKRPGTHCDKQSEINDLLIRLARSGKHVVRLKGGDPFVFGRGAEEAEALSEAGIPFEVVPAPSAATAVPAYAGIPVTDRRWSSSVAIVTGHCITGAVEWKKMADAVDTIVVLMGRARIGDIVQGLLDGGLPDDTPSAIIENGTLGNQQVVTAGLAELPAEADRAEVGSPATIVVGEVVRTRQKVAWFQPEKAGR